MKKAIMALFVIALLAVIVSAANDEEQGKAMKANNVTGNMTFGNCVSEAAKVRNTCYDAAKTAKETCTGGNETAAKDCNKTYKQEKNKCKLDFKTTKKQECGKIKHNFMDSLKASFK